MSTGSAAASRRISLKSDLSISPANLFLYPPYHHEQKVILSLENGTPTQDPVLFALILRRSRKMKVRLSKSQGTLKPGCKVGLQIDFLAGYDLTEENAKFEFDIFVHWTWKSLLPTPSNDWWNHEDHNVQQVKVVLEGADEAKEIRGYRFSLQKYLRERQCQIRTPKSPLEAWMKSQQQQQQQQQLLSLESSTMAKDSGFEASKDRSVSHTGGSKDDDSPAAAAAAGQLCVIQNGIFLEQGSPRKNPSEHWEEELAQEIWRELRINDDLIHEIEKEANEDLRHIEESLNHWPESMVSKMFSMLQKT